MPGEGTRPSQQRREVRTVEMNSPGFIDADQPTKSGQQVDRSGRFILDPATGDLAFPINDTRNAMSAFEKRSLLAPKLPVSLLQITAVVGGVDNDRVVEFAELFEPGNESPDSAIRIIDGAAVDGFPFVEPAILGNDLVRRRDRVVGFVEPEIEKEGLVAVALLIEPCESLIDDDLTGIAFDGPNAFSVAQEVGRVLVTGARSIDDAEPVVEAMIGGSGIVAILDRHA